MTSPTATVPTRVHLLGLSAAAAALVLGFVLGPRTLLGPPTTVPEDLARGLAALWRGGSGTLPADLDDLVTYWFRWHALKIAVCLALVVVSTLLARALWRRHQLVGRGATGAIATGGLALGTSVVLALNVQATAVPLAALLPLLPGRTGDPRTDAAIEALRDSLGAGRPPAGHAEAYATVVDAVQRSSVVLAVVSLVAVALLAMLAVRHLRASRRASRGSRTRVVHAATVGLVVVAVLAFVGLAVVGVTGALAPADAAAGLLAG